MLLGICIEVMLCRNWLHKKDFISSTGGKTKSKVVKSNHAFIFAHSTSACVEGRTLMVPFIMCVSCTQ